MRISRKIMHEPQFPERLALDGQLKIFIDIVYKVGFVDQNLKILAISLNLGKIIELIFLISQYRKFLKGHERSAPVGKLRGQIKPYKKIAVDSQPL